MAYRVDHVHLICPRIEEAAQWYCDMLGGKVTFSGDLKGIKVHYVEISGFRLILIERLPDEDPMPASIRSREGLDHFGLAVDDMDAAAADLKAKGVQFTMEPTQIREGVRIAYIEGPDKVRIELTERAQ